MRNFIFLTFLFLTVCAAGGSPASAQDRRVDSSPAAFRTFFANFRRAVERSDKPAVAALTRFPFKYGFDAGDEGTMTRRQFVKRFTDVFGDRPAEFFTEKNPRFSREGDKYYISTEDAAHLMFVRTGNGFKFASFIVEP